jgi:hypothetical protein
VVKVEIMLPAPDDPVELEHLLQWTMLAIAQLTARAPEGVRVHVTDDSPVVA